MYVGDVTPASGFSGRLEALFLDAGNTVIGMDLDLICERLAARSIRTTPEEIARAEAAARPAVSRRLAAGGASTETRDTFAFYLRRMLGGLGADRRPGVDELARELAVELKERFGTRRLWSRVLPGVPDALERLRAAGLALVVVSNSDGTIESVMRDAGLDGHLAAVIDSSRVGFEKPDPRIFRCALERTGTDAARTAHVGDLYSVDVAGARAAGLHAVLLDPFGDWPEVDCTRAVDLATLADGILEARRAAQAG